MLFMCKLAHVYRWCASLAGWRNKVLLVGSLFTLEPFGKESEAERSRERYRRIALSSIAGIGAKSIAVLTSLITVPLTLHYLGMERYGMWMAISSIIALLGFADLGLGNGLLSAIAAANGRNDREASRKSVSSAFFILLALTAGLIAIACACYQWAPWGRVYNVTSKAALAEAGPATALMLLCFAVNLPLSIVQKVQMGYQEGFEAGLWSALGAVFGFAGVLIAVNLKAGLPWLVLGMSGGPLLAAALSWGWVFCRSKQWLAPSWRTFDWNTSVQLISSGGWFLVLQLCAFLGNATDNLVVAHVVGVSSVASYAVTQKLFSITQVAQYFIMPLWPAVGEAIARNDFAWAGRTLNRALILSTILGLAAALPLCFFGGDIVALWAGRDVVPTFAVVLGFSCWVLLAGYGGVMSAFLNRGELLRRQTWFYALASIITVGLKILLAFKWGAAGVIWATVIGYSCFYAIPAAKLAYGSINKPVTVL